MGPESEISGSLRNLKPEKNFIRNRNKGKKKIKVKYQIYFAGVKKKCFLTILNSSLSSCYQWSHMLRPRSLMLMWRCLKLLSRFLVKDHLSRMSRQSRLSTNDKCDNEMIPGLCTDFVAFTLQLRKSPENLS